MLLFFSDLSYELSVPLDPGRMSFEHAAGAALHGTYRTSKKVAVFGALEA